MPEVTRQLAAIMFTDIVGYSSLMGSDEDRALEVLRENREIHTRLIKDFNGTLVKEMGDGMLISFNLASDAVRCAIEIQKACKGKDIQLKIGIHEGEMVFEGADVLGDVVNLASRLQEDAEEGCINISGSVYRNIKNKVDLHARFIKEKSFKNVDEPVKVYRILEEEGEQIILKKEPSKLNKKFLYYLLSGIAIVMVAAILILNYFPKQEGDYNYDVAVMYMENLTDNEKFGDQLVHLIHTNLSQDTSLKMVSRQKIYDAMQDITGESRNPDRKSATEVARRVGVRTMIFGQAMQQEEKVITQIELIDVSTGDIISTEKVEGQINRIFDLADAITLKISEGSDYEREFDVAQITTGNYEAFKIYYEGIEAIWNWQFGNANQKFRKAIELDSTFALAYMYYAISLNYSLFLGSLNADIGESMEFTQTAMTLSSRLSKKDKLLLRSADALYKGDIKSASEYLDRLDKMDPDSRISMMWRYGLAAWGDDSIYESKISDFLRRNPGYGFNLNIYAHYKVYTGQLDEGISHANRYIELEPNSRNPYHSAWEVNMMAGKEDEGLRFLDSLEVKFPRNGASWKGYHYLMTNQPDRSHQVYDLFKDSISYSYLQLQGPNSLLLKGQFKRASMEMDRIINKNEFQPLTSRYDNPTIVPFHFRIEKGIALIAAGEYDNANDVFDSIIDLPKEIPLSQVNPYIFQSYYYRGISNIRSGNYHMARSSLEQLKIMINEKTVDWRYYDIPGLLEGELLLVEKELNELEEKLSTMYNNTKWNSPHYMSLLYRLYWGKGEYQQALDILMPFYRNTMRSQEYVGGNVTYYCWELAFSDYHIGQIYEDAGKPEEAIRYFQIFLDNFSESDPEILEKEDARRRIDQLKLLESNR